MKFSDLALQDLCEGIWEVANNELLNSKEIKRELYENVITQNKDYLIDTKKTKTIKNESSTKKISNYKVKLGEVGNSVKEKKNVATTSRRKQDHQTDKAGYKSANSTLY